jgi:hypothetical protein
MPIARRYSGLKIGILLKIMTKLINRHYFPWHAAVCIFFVPTAGKL